MGLIPLFYSPQFTVSPEDRELSKTLVKGGYGTVYVFLILQSIAVKALA